MTSDERHIIVDAQTHRRIAILAAEADVRLGEAAAAAVAVLFSDPERTEKVKALAAPRETP